VFYLAVNVYNILITLIKRSQGGRGAVDRDYDNGADVCKLQSDN
jgi:hypothetical protein